MLGCTGSSSPAATSPSAAGAVASPPRTTSSSTTGLTPYVRSRVQAEDMVMHTRVEHGLPAVAMCVSTTYGAGDWGRTPHGAIIAGAAFGKCRS